ncbi:MAG: ribulokinase [Acholeplasmataceae bacterium]
MPYVIGADFGTLSARFILVDPKNGEETHTVILSYPHGVMDQVLNDVTLPEDYALQDASDYLEVLEKGIRKLITEADVSGDRIIGIGIDFTASTILPVDRDLEPMSTHDEYRNNPHAYVKLWKHHAAQAHATKAAEIARERGERFIERYGNQISSEWMIPKVMEIINEDRALYDSTARFIEAGDFIVSRLVGSESRSACQAGYKAFWNKHDGYPSKDYFKALDPGLETLIADKMPGTVKPVGSIAGFLTETMSEKLGLKAGIPVTTAYIDAHSAVPALGITTPGKMVMILGTSTCHMVLDEKEILVKGISGVVEDGIIPGLYGYEAGQASVGDALDWFVDHLLPERYAKEASERGISPYALLEEKALKKFPGEAGLVALDWLNGNRSILSDSDLSGLIVGLSLRTSPEDIYRALIEATAYGTRVIIEEFTKEGIAIDELYATGGISKKSPLFMQIYADVTDRTIRIGKSDQAVALGSAIAAAAAAGKEQGGYDSIREASERMGKLEDTIYVPNPTNVARYEKLYAIYRELHDGFGSADPSVMHRLKTMKRGM